MKTLLLSALDAQTPEIAADLIRQGELVAIPTETVYGLGANGLDEAAVTKIFEAKGRPQDNPLILHICGAEQIELFCHDVPAAAYELAKEFWPGPLTMVLPARDCVPRRTTGGLSTVAVRCPDNAVTREIIRLAGVPIAAPSANISGKPSTTTAQHVLHDHDGKIAAIVDGGPCRVGVESTIVDLTEDRPRLLRPGGITPEQLISVLGDLVIDKAVTAQIDKDAVVKAPGMKYRHYAPAEPVVIVSGSREKAAAYIRRHFTPGDRVLCFEEELPLYAGCSPLSYGREADVNTLSAGLFAALRELDDPGIHQVYARCPVGGGVAYAVQNRLKKAAGFHTEEADGAFVLGITGGTGAGKTTLLHALERRGALVLDCDAVYHEMLRTDAPLRADLTAAFGDVFAPDGGLDRQKLGNIVFGDAGALAQLDAIIFRHLPRALARRMEESGARLIALDAIKLVESGLGALCDVTVAVTAPEEVRVRRIMTRDGISEDYARARVRAQRSEEAFRADCDEVFENNYPTPAQAAFAAEEFLDTIIKKSKEE